MKIKAKRLFQEAVDAGEEEDGLKWMHLVLEIEEDVFSWGFDNKLRGQLEEERLGGDEK